MQRFGGVEAQLHAFLTSALDGVNKEYQPLFLQLSFPVFSLPNMTTFECIKNAVGLLVKGWKEASVVQETSADAFNTQFDKGR
jgi:hypothetical protein